MELNSLSASERPRFLHLYKVAKFYCYATPHPPPRGVGVCVARLHGGAFENPFEYSKLLRTAKVCGVCGEVLTTGPPWRPPSRAPGQTASFSFQLNAPFGRPVGPWAGRERCLLPPLSACDLGDRRVHRGSGEGTHLRCGHGTRVPRPFPRQEGNGCAPAQGGLPQKGAHTTPGRAGVGGWGGGG